ncbi:MAG: glycoside hydrolase 5 family protein [Pirellulaceae bacterium]
MRRVACLLLIIASVLLSPRSRAASEEPAAIPAVQQPAGGSIPAAKIAILNDALPGFDRECARRLAKELRGTGCDVTELSAAEVCDASILSPERFFLYVIPQCRIYPAAGLEALVAFASGRGHVLFLGGPFLDDPVWPTAAGWINRAAIAAAKTGSGPQRGLWADKPLSTKGWLRTCNDMSTPGSWEVVNDGPQGQPCLRFWTKNLTGWDGYLSPDTPQLFAEQHALLSFQAKGSPATRQIVVEIQEQDGSRWMAVVDVSPQWQRSGLDAQDFQYWSDSPTRDRRGGAGDHLQFSQARRISFHLAFSPATALTPGEHTFWITDVGTSVHPIANLTLTAPTNGVTLETIFPRYKVYSLENSASLRPTTHPGVTAASEWPKTAGLVCGIPRTMGRGFLKEQKWRYLPVLEAVDDLGQSRGNPAWLLLNRSPSYSGSVFACLGVNDPAVLQTPASLSVITAIVTRLRRGVFLQEAGAEHFAYWPNEQAQLGARVVNVGSAEQTVEVRITICDAQADAKVLLSQSTTMNVLSRENGCWDKLTFAVGPEPATYTVSTELLREGTLLDRIDHDINVLDTRVPAKQEFMMVQGSNFYRGGRPWYPVGINYWPLYVSGMDHEDFWAGWHPQRYYDPVQVEQDLVRMKALGINMVSIQAPDKQFYRNLLDFVYRCRKHDIFVNLFCGLASPLAFQEKELQEYIATARLADNPTIMAYDTIWEPGNYVFQGDRRSGWDDAWRDWVVEQYGSIEAAEADWGVTGQRDPQKRLTSPPDEHFRTDGPWRTLMAAYRRFMDDLTSRKWNRAHRKLREFDPNHLISFRQGNTLPHDFVFTGTPKHIDFICPEGYSIPDSEDGYNAAGFITKYVHFTTGGKPIVWAEFGQSVWDPKPMSPSPVRIEEVSKYHELFYRMALESGANGTIPWWWPGGFRVGENSDFGIIHPDGSPRPAAQLITTYGPRLQTERQWPTATAWFDMDRDAHAGGYWYTCFNTGRDAYRRAVEAGQQLEIRTAGTGTTSATTPLIAVGNRPATGHNPPKFLNAEFNELWIQDAGGKWVAAGNGDSISVSPTGPVKARVCVGNTQEATWLAPQGNDVQPGTVVLQTTASSEVHGQWMLPAETPYLADADFGEITLTEQITQPVKVELRMAVAGRTGFGEKRSFILRTQGQ